MRAHTPSEESQFHHMKWNLIQCTHILFICGTWKRPWKILSFKDIGTITSMHCCVHVSQGLGLGEVHVCARECICMYEVCIAMYRTVLKTVLRSSSEKKLRFFEFRICSSFADINRFGSSGFSMSSSDRMRSRINGRLCCSIYIYMCVYETGAGKKT